MRLFARTLACVAAIAVAAACANLGSFEEIVPPTGTTPAGSSSGGGDAPDGSDPGASSSSSSSSSSTSTSSGTSGSTSTSSGGSSGGASDASGTDANTSSGTVDSGPQCLPPLKANGQGCSDKAQCCSEVCNEERKCNDTCKNVNEGGCAPYGDDCCLGGYCVLGLCKQCAGAGEDVDEFFGNRSCCSGSSSAGKCN